MVQQIRRIPTEIQTPQAIAAEWDCFRYPRIQCERSWADDRISRSVSEARGGNVERRRIEPLQHSRIRQRGIAGLVGALGVRTRNTLARLIFRENPHREWGAGMRRERTAHAPRAEHILFPTLGGKTLAIAKRE